MISLIPSAGYTSAPAEHDTCLLHAVGPPPGIQLVLWVGITRTALSLETLVTLWAQGLCVPAFASDSFLSSRNRALSRSLSFSCCPLSFGKGSCRWAEEHGLRSRLEAVNLFEGMLLS